MSSKKDKIFTIIGKECNRARKSINLIASENFASIEVMKAAGSILTNKYAEGYPKNRYYAGCIHIDQIEEIAITRAKKLFGAHYVNVQPHSGSQANLSVFLSLLKPGDTILSMSLKSGGHLSHGTYVNVSGKWFNSIQYEVDKTSYLIDYDIINELAIKNKPRLIIAGCSAYSRKIDFKKFKEIANKVNAFLLADISHISGIVATGHHENPTNIADVVTSTTHKTLRGPRGGIILSNNSHLQKQLNNSVFPMLQGGPMMHIIAAKAICFKEALQNEFSDYITNVIQNSKALAKQLYKKGYEILTKGTDNHMFLVDLRNKKIKGNIAEEALQKIGIIANKNSLPFDTENPLITSGLRLGTAAITTLNFTTTEVKQVADIIADLLHQISHCKENIDYIQFQNRVNQLLITKKQIFSNLGL